MTKLFSYRVTVALAAVIALQGQTGGSRQFAIVDPVLQMPAWTFPLPAGWNAQGTMLPPPTCSTATAPVVKIVSPDGRAGAYLLPTFTWAWGAAGPSGGDCLPWHAPISAREFLTFFAATEKVNILHDEPVSGVETLRRDMAQYGGTGDKAAVLAHYAVKGLPMDERLFATVTCQTFTSAVVGEQHRCAATVIRWFAPSGKLEALAPTFDSMKMTLNPQWMSEWQAKMVAHSVATSQGETNRLLQQGNIAQASRMQQHKAFMDNFAAEGRARDVTFAKHQYTRQQQSDNFVDYVLDCQRVYSGNSRVSVGNLCPNRQTL